MNEHLFAEIPATSPQHTRRIISDELRVLAYCTVCSWYMHTEGDAYKLHDLMAGWATHLEKILAYQETPDGPYKSQREVAEELGLVDRIVNQP